MKTKEISPVSIRNMTKSQELAIQINEGVVIEVNADAFFRTIQKRRPKEDFDVYKRSLRNQAKAMKVRLKYGPKATVLLNKETICVV